VSILVAAIDSSNYPVKAIIHLLAVNLQPPNAPLFSFSRQLFTKNRVQTTLTNKLKSKGIDSNSITLYSFYKGVAQHAKDSSLQDDQIQTLGRWLLQAFKLYFKTLAATLYAYNI
jgi:hypothetical protein